MLIKTTQKSSKLLYMAFLCYMSCLCAQAQGYQLVQSTNVFNRVQFAPGLSGLTDAKGSATDGQFKSIMSFGASAPYDSKNAAKDRVYVTPKSQDGSYKIGFARIAAPFYGKSTSFKFGQVIPPPKIDEHGDELENVEPSDYWVAEPFSTSNRYYYSPSTRQVFATQAGPVDITWRARLPTAGISGVSDENYELIGGKYYAKLTKRYIIDGSAFKTPRKIYWTGDKDAGVPVTIPNDLLDNVKIIYNDSFVKNVPVSEGQPLGEDTGITGSGSANTNSYTATLWYDRSENALKALNREGRVFVELLGTPNDNTGLPQHLGYEIVDVVRTPVIIDPPIVELGDSFPIRTSRIKDKNGILREVDLVARAPKAIQGEAFIYRHFKSSEGRPTLYAKKKTVNRNDLVFWWMEEGDQGILWPKEYVRYDLQWPTDIEKYSHYIRPQVANRKEAQDTAVVLPAITIPNIDYQDPDKIDGDLRGHITGDYKYYSHLDTSCPAHRALIRFTAGNNVHYERVYSWLDDALKQDVSFAGSVVEDLGAWDSSAQTLNIADSPKAPRLHSETVFVGQRITPPAGELGSVTTVDDYLSGYINYDETLERGRGDLFSATAYIDPLSEGFEEANKGSIIPVNSMPNDNKLEVWWFRDTNFESEKGFSSVYWPSVIATYNIEWPLEGNSFYREIVLASNDGSGPLASLQANGRVYFQNNPSKPGYNPNEEHALMIGGQAYALRDDLNIRSGDKFSSEPAVLIEYSDSDMRPSVDVYNVLREKGTVTFDYEVEAGTVLQPPMPLPLMAKPLVNRTPGQPPASLNDEIAPIIVKSSEKGVDHLTKLDSSATIVFPTYSTLTLQDITDTPRVYKWFVATNVDVDGSYIKGVVSKSPPSAIITFREPSPDSLTYVIDEDVSSVGDNLYIINSTSKTHHQATVSKAELVGGQYEVTVDFQTATVPEEAKTANILAVVDDEVSPDFTNWRLGPEPLPSNMKDIDSAQLGSLFTFQDRKGDLWVYRGPHDPENDKPILQFQYYYKTLEGFYFPSADKQPAPGTITPYLRPIVDGVFNDLKYNPVKGDADDDKIGDKNALPITYRPVWPQDAPMLHMAETLTLPKRGLPAIRGHQSLQILYQQSQYINGGDLGRPSVVLHDPTRDKIYLLKDGAEDLKDIPGSVNTQGYQGKLYFPNLPPHLSERFFYDPALGEKGGLVLRGEFVNSPTGEDYLNLNVLSTNDLETLEGLIHEDDANKKEWEFALKNLTTSLDRFVENATKPGTYAPMPSANVVVPPRELAEIDNDDVAVDSYALTATGPGVGFVTLISGNGLAFQEAGEPVSMHVLRVTDTLHRGELKVIESSNPLSEKVGFQQVVDLAAKTDLYNYEWRISAPIDGASPKVYQNTAKSISTSGGEWRHLQYPLPNDRPGNADDDPLRISKITGGAFSVVSGIQFETVSEDDGIFEFTYNGTTTLVEGNLVEIILKDGSSVSGKVSTIATNNVFEITTDSINSFGPAEIESLSEITVSSVPTSILFKDINIPADSRFSEFWLSLELGDNLHSKVYLNGNLLVTANSKTSSDTSPSSPPRSIQTLPFAYRISPDDIPMGDVRIVVELFSNARANTAQSFDLKLDAFEAVDLTQEAGTPWMVIDEAEVPDGIRAVLGGTADIRTLSDNWVIMRYQAKKDDHASFVSDGNGGNKSWSHWTEPQLAEGWIKRVLKGINPFNQRVTDLFSNQVNTDASILTQAGQRWEGNVALNLGSINDFGLIEIYETVLNRGKSLSIDSGINYGPANDALLLAAGYLNDLYMMVGNDAWADASNPTIGIGTKNKTYGDIATSLFSFKGQLPTLLEEELALLRGRDDFLQPGVETAPVYNRLFWNYTRGIDSGEVIYALNYNIAEDEDDAVNGKIDADDARQMYPQGHGDAYGHYLTALKGYYKLILDPDFTWVPRTEAVLILDKAVQVDYLDERKFATAAVAKARTGKEIFDLTVRKDYQSGVKGWSHLENTRDNDSRQLASTRFWGADHWANRTYQGAYYDWVTGNSLLPDVDPDPTHEGIQLVDRTTVPELKSLVTIAEDLQTSLDNAEAGLNPLGFAEDAMSFDVNPNIVVNQNNETHFEQVYKRASKTLNNAVVAFDDAKDITRLMRSEQDELNDFRSAVAKEELAFKHRLIELYGTPYSDDIGPGKTYKQGYDGPDLYHYAYIDDIIPHTKLYGDPEAYLETATFKLDIDPYEIDYVNAVFNDGVAMEKYPYKEELSDKLQGSFKKGVAYIDFTVNSEGFATKPPSWVGRRSSPGKIQTAISNLILAHNKLKSACEDHVAAKDAVDSEYTIFLADNSRARTIREKMGIKLGADTIFDGITTGFEIADEVGALAIDLTKDMHLAAINSMPTSVILGLATGGDLASPARAALGAGHIIAKNGLEGALLSKFGVQKALEVAHRETERWFEYGQIAPLERQHEVRNALFSLDTNLGDLAAHWGRINEFIIEHDEAQRALWKVIAEGNRIQSEREIFRQRSSAIVQGFRTRDAGFRIFRNEKLERYKTLFDIAAEYAFLSAKAYDYETGLLNTEVGKSFVNRIISARSLGVVIDEEPQFAGSNAGDPGISSVLAEMKGDWDVLKGRLGYNNPDGQGTTVSLRSENYRILPGGDGDDKWRDLLESCRMDNILTDGDVRRYAMHVDSEAGLPVPGIVLDFSTTIQKGYNIFGRPIAGGDHSFSSALFATKIFAVGVAFEGYIGMSNPSPNNSAIIQSGGVSPVNVSAPFLDASALSATPEVFLIPVGLDIMRSPPLGDQNNIRSWNVRDVAIPLPFNVGASDFSSKALWQGRDSLADDLYTIRKHAPFRPVSTTAAFGNEVYGRNSLKLSQYTNNRLIGRSVWNTKWKIVIPGHALLNNPKEGLDRFIRTVDDVKLHFVTYSYAGN